MQLWLPQNAGQVPAELKSAASAWSNAKAWGVWAVLDNPKVKLHVAVACADGSAAGDLATGVQTWWDKNAKGLAALYIRGAIAKGLPKPVQTVADEMMNSTKFESQGAMAEMSAETNLQSVEDVVKDVAKGAQNSP
jgi:hypothetical protein